MPRLWGLWEAVGVGTLGAACCRPDLVPLVCPGLDASPPASTHELTIPNDVSIPAPSASPDHPDHSPPFPRLGTAATERHTTSRSRETRQERSQGDFGAGPEEHVGQERSEGLLQQDTRSRCQGLSLRRAPLTKWPHEPPPYTRSALPAVL